MSIVRVIQRIAYLGLLGALLGSAIYTGFAQKVFAELSERILVAYNVMGAGSATILIAFVGVIISLMLASIIKG